MTPPAPVPDPQREQIAEQIAEVTGCHRLTDGVAEWCETHGDDWPCKVGRLLSLMAADPLRQRVEKLAEEWQAQVTRYGTASCNAPLSERLAELRRALGTEAGDGQ